MQNSIRLLVLLTLFTSFLSCKDDDTDINDNIPNSDIKIPTPTSEYYFSGIIDGKPLLIQANNGTLLTSGNCTDISQDEINGGMWIDLDLTTFEEIPRAFAGIYIANEGTDVLQKRFDSFSVGKKGIFDCKSGVLKGGEIIHYDEKGNEWSSNGPQNNTAYFEVLERKGTWTGDRTTSTASIDIKGKFRCILYDSTGNSKEITNGEFNSVFHFIN